MTTAFQSYVKAIDDHNELFGDDLVDDYHERKVYSLRERDQAEEWMAAELDRQSPGLVFWNLPEEDQDALMDQVDRWKGGTATYREAVRDWLRRRDAKP